MSTQPDPIREAFAPLRARTWERPEHQRRLEQELQEKMNMSMRTSLWAKAAMITGIFLVGGIAGAGTLAFVEHYFVEETELPGDMRHVRITDTTNGHVVMEDDIPNDSGILAIDGGDDGDTLLNVQKVPDGNGETPAPAPAQGGH